MLVYFRWFVFIAKYLKHRITEPHRVGGDASDNNFSFFKM